MKSQGLKPKAIERMIGRIYVKTDNTSEISNALTKVFGITSFSMAKQTNSDIESISEVTLSLSEDVLQNGSSFAVRCHRVGTQPYSSLELCGELGGRIQENLEDKKLRVNLTSPDTTINLEVRDKDAYVSAVTIQGAGGFPVGTQAKTVCLLSGGIDSPVACWLAMKRGSPVVPIYVDNAPYTDETTKQKAVRVAVKLKEWSSGYLNRMYIIPNGENMKVFHEKAERRFSGQFLG